MCMEAKCLRDQKDQVPRSDVACSKVGNFQIPDKISVGDSKQYASSESTSHPHYFVSPPTDSQVVANYRQPIPTNYDHQSSISSLSSLFSSGTNFAGGTFNLFQFSGVDPSVVTKRILDLTFRK
jgi:hypothetical protein